MWTTEQRQRHDRAGLRYPSDLSDGEWALVEPFIPWARRGGRRRTVEVREVLNGLLHVLATGCQWRALPKDLPPRSTVQATSCFGPGTGRWGAWKRFLRHCQVGGRRTNPPLLWLLSHGRSGSTGDVGDIAPSPKGTITGGSMFGSGQEVAAKPEEVVNLVVAGEEPLGVLCRHQPDRETAAKLHHQAGHDQSVPLGKVACATQQVSSGTSNGTCGCSDIGIGLQEGRLAPAPV